MLLIPHNDSLNHFSQVVLMELYYKLNFPQRAQIFETFLPSVVELPKKNPPYPLFNIKTILTLTPVFIISSLIFTNSRL